MTLNPELKLLQYNLGTPLAFQESENFMPEKGNFSRLTLFFRFERQIGHHLIQTFAPSALVVQLSWFSFWLGLDAIPGRVTLLVTCMLTLVTMFTGADIPPVAYVKALDVWMAGCMMFVFGALAEFVVVKWMHAQYTNQLNKCAAAVAVRPNQMVSCNKAESHSNSPHFLILHRSRSETKCTREGPISISGDVGARNKYRWGRISASTATDSNLSHCPGTSANKQFGTRERKWTATKAYPKTELVVCGVDRSGDWAGSRVVEGDRQNIEDRLSIVVPRVRRSLLAAASAKIFVGQRDTRRVFLGEMHCDIFARRDDDDQHRMIQIENAFDPYNNINRCCRQYKSYYNDNQNSGSIHSRSCYCRLFADRYRI